MKLIQKVAGAAITCTLAAAGIGLASSVASAAPCIQSPGAQCGGPDRPGGPPQGEARGPGGHGSAASFVDFRIPGGPSRAGGGGGGGFGGPGGSAAPGGPSGPAAPAGPGAPSGPTGPAGPDAPSGPGGPAAPAAPGGPGGPDNHGPGMSGEPDGHDWRPPWNPSDNDWRGRFQGAPWGKGLPPWGRGPPPRPPWDGPLPPAWGPPPPQIDYCGFDEQPVWDPRHKQWGFWFFGIWIPLPS